MILARLFAATFVANVLLCTQAVLPFGKSVSALHAKSHKYRFYNLSDKEIEVYIPFTGGLCSVDPNPRHETIKPNSFIDVRDWQTCFLCINCGGCWYGSLTINGQHPLFKGPEEVADSQEFPQALWNHFIEGPEGITLFFNETPEGWVAVTFQDIRTYVGSVQPEPFAELIQKVRTTPEEKTSVREWEFVPVNNVP
jgi:hypothetical protein